MSWLTHSRAGEGASESESLSSLSPSGTCIVSMLGLFIDGILLAGLKRHPPRRRRRALPGPRRPEVFPTFIGRGRG